MIGVTYTGTDGSTWDLRRGQVRIAKGGLQGLGFPAMTEYTTSSAFLDGQDFDGFKSEARRLILPLLIGADTGNPEDWEALEVAFWNACRPGLPAQLAVTSPSGKVRTAYVRFSDDGGVSYDTDPSEEAFSAVSVAWTADRPLFYGTPVVRTFDAGDDAANFFGGAAGNGFAPDFYISGSSTVESATIDNPGDVDVWPSYTLNGQVLGFRSALGGGLVSGTNLAGPGQQLVLDTDPRAQIALLTDLGTGNVVDETGLLAAVDWRPVPAGTSAQLDIEIDGPASLEVRLQPLFYRGF